jgi:hypothetical protein
VKEQEKVLKELDRTDPMFADKKEKIEETVPVLIIEESSFDAEIRLLKQKQGKQKQKVDLKKIFRS